MDRVAMGDGDAFAELFRRHSPVVLGFLVRMVGQREEAEEILQDSFIQAWHQASRFRPTQATPRGWLLMLARSRAIDRIRASNSRARREASASGQWREAIKPVGTRELEADERKERVASALVGLPAEQRRCVELAFFAGLSHSQIAAKLNQPLGTVKSRILLGMTKLRRTLAPYQAQSG